MKKQNKRVIIIVLDGVGTGEAPDAAQFGDVGADTLGHVIQHRPHIHLPNMTRLGLKHMRNAFNGDNLPVESAPIGGYGRCIEQSMGKDTTIGHWEIAGIITPQPFPTYPDGFPQDLIDEFTTLTGYGVLGNKPASGTQIIQELGQEHIDSGKLIVYTSADSVFQIAAHDSVVDIDQLYDICRKARTILKGQHACARVIARPFTGDYPNFTRTADRKDFSLVPGYNMMNVIQDAGLESVSVGKIEDIFAASGVTKAIHTHGNVECMPATLDEIQRNYGGLLFVNLVDFDMIYGHRNNLEGFADALEAADDYIGQYMDAMTDDDLLIITADHGVDPGFPGTDHTREYIPLLVYSKQMASGVDLDTRQTYADIAATTLDHLGLPTDDVEGTSFLPHLNI